MNDLRLVPLVFRTRRVVSHPRSHDDDDDDDDDGERAMEANDGRFLSSGARLRTDARPTRRRELDFIDERELEWE
jgi:hypothetical protein